MALTAHFSIKIIHIIHIIICLFQPASANLQDLIPTLALVVCDAYNYAAKVGIKSCRFV